MERNPETSQMMLLGLQRLATTVLRDALRGEGALEFLPLGETFTSGGSGGSRPTMAGMHVDELLRESSFAEVVWLLHHRELPSVEFLADLQSLLAQAAGEIPEAVERLLVDLPIHVSETEVLRVGLSALSAFDPQLDDVELHSDFGKTIRLLAAAPALLHARSAPDIEADHDAGFAARLAVPLACRELTGGMERAIDAILIALAEQSRDPSTLAARVVASNGGDVYAAVSAALAAVDVRVAERHCRRIDALLDEMEEVEDLPGWLERVLGSESRLPGFEPERERDARVAALDELCSTLSSEAECDQTERGARLLERLVADRRQEQPTLLWPIARLLRYAGFGPDALGPLLIVARLAGWSAHACEELQSHRRLVGLFDESEETRDYVPLEERG